MRNGVPFGFAAAGSLLAALLGTGCRNVLQTAADVPAEAVRTVRTVTPVVTKPAEPSVDPVEVQQTLMRFASEFASRMTLGVELLRRGDRELGHAERLRWKLAFNTAAFSIATGPNAVSSLLDMTVYVTETRMSLEEYWKPKVFGDSALPLLESGRACETEIWELANRVLKPEQKAALREAIQLWHQQSTTPESLMVVRAVGLALEVSKVNKPELLKSGNILGLLMLDPLAELDPTRRELAQTRLFAERAMFVSQKMPTLLRWQTELLSAEMLEQPTWQQWSTNAAQVAASADRFSRAAEQWPRQIEAERAAIVQALQAQEGALRPLLGETRQTLAEARAALEAGTQMSTSLNTTLATFNGVLKQLGVGEPDSPAPTNSAPFRIQDYERTAAQLEGTARQLTELLRTFDHAFGAESRSQLAAQLDPVVQQAQARGKSLVDYAFWRGVLFVAIALGAALLYRLLARLISRRESSGAGGREPR